MKVKIIILWSCVLTSILASACGPTIQTVEVTRIVSRTVVVTQLVQVPITMTPVPIDTPMSATSTPVPTETPEPTHVIDLSKQDGSIVIVQYYTLLDLHLYEQAYDLLSSSNEWRRSNDKYKAQYVEQQRIDSKVVKILQLYRYKDYLKQNGRDASKVSDNWYLVQLYAEGENGLAGAYPNGIQPGIYIRVTFENGQWKIDEFSSMAY
jgi:hypothetical protein